MKAIRSIVECAAVVAAVSVLSFLAGVGFMSGVVHAMRNHEATVVVFAKPKKPDGQGGV